MRPTLTCAWSCDPVVIFCWQNERHGGVRQCECKCGFLWKKAFSVEELIGLGHRTTSIIYSLKFTFILFGVRWTYLVNKYVQWRINRSSSAICHRYESKSHSYIKPFTVACAVHGRGASAFQRLGTKAPSTIPHSSCQGKQDTRLAWATSSGSLIYRDIWGLRECVLLGRFVTILAVNFSVCTLVLVRIGKPEVHMEYKPTLGLLL